MAETGTQYNPSYNDAKERFLSTANLFLIKSYNVAKCDYSPELKISLQAIAAALETFLIDLDKGFDKAWKEQLNEMSVSLEEVRAVAEELQVTGLALKDAMDESWPIIEDLSVFLDELTTVRNKIHT